LILLGNPVKESSAYRVYLDDPRKVIELGKNDYWYEPVIYENRFYDVSATVRVLTTLWVRARRRYVDSERLLDGGWLLRSAEFNPNSTAFRIQTILLER